MKDKKPLVILLALLAILVSGGAIFVYASPSHANAHTERHRPDISMKHGMSARLTKELGLTPEQEPIISQIVGDTEKKIQEMQKDKSIKAEDKRKKMGELFKAASANIERNLSPDQIDKYRKMLGSMPGHRM